MKKYKAWTYSDIEFAMDYHGVKSPKQIAEKLERSVPSIKALFSHYAIWDKNPDTYKYSQSWKQFFAQYKLREDQLNVNTNGVNDSTGSTYPAQTESPVENTSINKLSEALERLQQLIIEVIESEVKKQSSKAVFQAELRASKKIKDVNDELIKLREFRDLAKKSNFGERLKGILG